MIENGGSGLIIHRKKEKEIEIYNMLTSSISIPFTDHHLTKHILSKSLLYKDYQLEVIGAQAPKKNILSFSTLKEYQEPDTLESDMKLFNDDFNDYII